MIEGVARLWPNSRQVAFSLEDEHEVFVGAGGSGRGAAPAGVAGVEEREGDVEPLAVVGHGEASLGEDRVAEVESEFVLRVRRPRARVQVEDNVVTATTPPFERRDLRSDRRGIVRAQMVAVERVDGEDEEARLARVARVVLRVAHRVQDLPVLRGDALPARRVDVHPEASGAQGEVKTALHPTPLRPRRAAAASPRGDMQVGVGRIAVGVASALVEGAAESGGHERRRAGWGGDVEEDKDAQQDTDDDVTSYSLHRPDTFGCCADTTAPSLCRPSPLDK